MKSKLQYAKITLKEKMNQHDLFSKGWGFGFNRRTRSVAVTKFKSKQIELSMNFIENKKVTNEKILNAILHEIAHAIVGCKEGHNRIWRNKAIEIGYKIRRKNL